ncbi:MAG TPA: PepSY domain-containing protein [Caulobacteraceae bacterium]|nr:PepSY domain-containing protein [Caulobacteraceae bacterium]
MRNLLMGGLKWLYIVHRWLGIATCILCAIWFVSGLVMVYVPYPAFTEADRMAYSEPLSLERVAVTPDQALAAAKAKAFPSQFKLVMLRGEPVYRIVEGVERTSVSAVDGRVLGRASPAEAAAAVRRLVPDRQVGPVHEIVRDQWTVAQGFDPHRPLYRIGLAGADGLTLYVSSTTGEVIQDTRAKERLWNWMGSIPHWIYLTAIRQDNEVWRQAIMWTSGPAVIGAITGVWLGLLRLKPRKNGPLVRISPYRGWMQWHHLVGLAASLFVITWLVSGWLSVNPLHLFSRPPVSNAALARYADQDKPAFATDLAVLRGLPVRDAREARLIWMAGRPLVVLMGTSLAETVLDARTGTPVSLPRLTLVANARTLVPTARVQFVKLLTEDDDYWYSTRRNPRRLPVLRVGFDDVDRTWVHIDPVTGEVLGRTDRSGRVYRWLFNLPHAFDLPILMRHSPSREAIIWFLSIGGLVVSVSGVVIGWRRLKLKFGIRRKARAAPPIKTGSAS